MDGIGRVGGQSYRYFHRQTRNPAFRHLWLVVHLLHRRCRTLIRRAR